MPVPDVEAVRQTGRAVADGAAQAAASVASGAARTARTAAYRGTRPIVNFAAGIGYFFRGCGRFLGSPALWPYAVAPLVLLPLAMFGIAHTVGSGAFAVIDWFTGGWPQWIHDTVGEILLWGVRIGVHFALGYLVLPLSIVLGAPCYVLLARRLERRLGPVEPTAATGAGAGVTGRTPSLWRASGVAIRQAVLVTIVVQLGWLLLVPLLLVPGLNVFVAVGAVATFNGFLVGLLMLAIPLHHHGTATFRGQLRAVWRHRASAIGFGATSALLLGVPVTPLRALVAPMVFTGAVLLHRRMRRADLVALGAPVAPAHVEPPSGTAVAVARPELPPGPATAQR
ncbi:EI24 domain-containing protein [Plantactinospora sp. KLBMP9567]|uniref:EI24 domain-containing protein n=1 Tax=Plantactinospora sp. KLBMP9567 TaxID=3085900 RepID=UPI00298188AD|nr:EI24 domain-containing protein [Plantactinospora sp. KLBMP9567]MDW5325429.1 EI24 domain-containing protein [Plantactinospora sp. KLBMP9567]